jgi:hypothetical protein
MTGAPPAAGDPATMVYGTQQHVFYRDVYGAIAHLYWNGASNTMGCQNWTTATHAPPAAGDPATLVFELQQHVFYRNTHGSISHIFWDQNSNLLHHDLWDEFMPLGAETPTGAFSYDGAAWVFVLHAGSSALTRSPTPTEPMPFQWQFSLSRWGTPSTAFLQVAPHVIDNAEFTGMLPSGDGAGVLLFGHGLGGEGWGVHLAWMPLVPGQAPARENVWYYQGEAQGWGQDQQAARRLFGTRFGWSSLSVGRVPATREWILLYQEAGTIDDNRASGTWDSPINARIAPTPWEMPAADAVRLFDPIREKARGSYMNESTEGPSRWPPHIGHPSFAYGAYLLNHYTEQNPNSGSVTIRYLLSTGDPYQVQVMESILGRTSTS